MAPEPGTRALGRILGHLAGLRLSQSRQLAAGAGGRSCQLCAAQEGHIVSPVPTGGLPPLRKATEPSRKERRRLGRRPQERKQADKNSWRGTVRAGKAGRVGQETGSRRGSHTEPPVTPWDGTARALSAGQPASILWLHSVRRPRAPRLQGAGTAGLLPSTQGQPCSAFSAPEFMEDVQCTAFPFAPEGVSDETGPARRKDSHESPAGLEPEGPGSALGSTLGLRAPRCSPSRRVGTGRGLFSGRSATPNLSSVALAARDPCTWNPAPRTCSD